MHSVIFFLKIVDEFKKNHSKVRLVPLGAIHDIHAEFDFSLIDKISR